ncbi:MAG: transglycosylase domain-containing protein [Minisyncoccia bacterium]
MLKGILQHRHTHHFLRYAVLAGTICAGVFVAWAFFATVPSIETIENRAVAESTKIYDRTGNVLLYDVHGAVRRTEVPFEEISPFIRNATVAIEDDSFYQHNGFRPMAFLRAILVNLHLRAGYRGQGGSTITQQVIKNTLLTADKTPIRKAKEIVLAMKLERIASKDEILNIYLNETSYGGTVYGVEEATQYFFGKAAKDVSLAEASYLAALPQAPTRYSPYGSHRDELEERKNLVLSRMLDLSYITEEEHTLAMQEQVQFHKKEEAGIKAPHFVFYVREYLEGKYGADVVANEGLRVITTLDWDLQQKAEEIVAEHAPRMEANFRATNTGIVAVDPKTGQILAMVGSRDFSDPAYGQVNVTTSRRQPGSSFKPFVYATAFEKGYTPETVVFDAQTQFSTACAPSDVANGEDPCYSPQNYDGLFKGPMKLRDALAQSQNIPAIKTLYLAGIQESIETARDMGITTLTDAARYGLTLVLGGGEVTLLEMTSAYGVFANDGIRNPPTGIMRVLDNSNETLEEYEQQESRALDPQIARQISDVLSDNVARTPEFGANSPLHFPGYKVADKTGTTNDFRDVWIVGYTPGISVGAWAGNNDNSPMERKIAAFIIAPMWHEFVEYALEKYPSDDFLPPAPDPEYDSLPAVLRGNWNTNPSLGVHDILYWVNKDEPRSGRSGSHSDSQFSYWEFGVALWSQGGVIGTGTPILTPGGQPGFAIATPSPNESIPLETFETFVEYETSLGVTSVSYYLGDEFVGVSNQPPFQIAIQPSQSGPTTLKAVADSLRGQVESTVTFTVQ